MILTHGYNDFLLFFKLYLDPKYDTLPLFMEKLIELNPDISEEEAEILWKSFDVAYNICVNYGGLLKEVKEAKDD